MERLVIDYLELFGGYFHGAASIADLLGCQGVVCGVLRTCSDLFKYFILYFVISDNPPLLLSYIGNMWWLNWPDRDDRRNRGS